MFSLDITRVHLYSVKYSLYFAELNKSIVFKYYLFKAHDINNNVFS